VRWLWQEWYDDHKPWSGTDVPCNEVDRFFFNASTTVSIGNGKKTKFWHHSWLDGEAPRNLAHHLFGFVKRKNKMVEQELNNSAGSKHFTAK